MGYKPRWHPFIIFLITTTTSTILSPLPQPPRSLPAPRNYALKPSITIIVGILTTIFSITFLILLYAKHCRRTPNRYPLVSVRNIARDNSGIDRTIIESLPVFRFGSLSGQKDGLECAVCLSVFDPSEVLRLLPKCKHAFHVECVDTWLDAHSTCPLCRYRVDPEDIFLIHEFSHNVVEIEEEKVSSSPISTTLMPVTFSLSRVSGRHSSAGEKVTGITSSAPSPPLPPETAGTVYSRRSLDSWAGKKKSVKKGKKKDATPADGDRKDGLLMERRRLEKRYEHRIVVGTERWSDVQPSDLLYLRSEMILSDVRRLKRSRPSVLHEGNNGWLQSGRGVINSRSVSEMTGLSRFGSNGGEAGVVSRLLARLTEPRSGRNSSSSNV